ncbi:SusC/RagA family TonB-linked outer membrane protein [Fulvitalea axinellae]|uniref:SusC/RagA family TonB-linked outer membrane protein n=1 Tax=Fulvitalea axinellae TaxID=1182444 RepID=A0AAU9CTZ7_9BACT|nr:SusC/RagA family TonB-linked outer membrane protein [Fulvitalea axinellae]
MHLRIFRLMRMSYYFLRRGVSLLFVLWVMSVFSFDTVAQLMASSKNQVTVREALGRLERNGDYVVFVKDELLGRKGSIEVSSPEGKAVKDYLMDLSRESGLKFKLVNKTIYVSEKTLLRKKQDQGFLLTGRIVDEDGEGLPGATVKKVGGTEGVITDLEGNFSIKVRLGEKLEFSYVGYESQVKTITAKTKVLIAMQVKAEELEGVTVVAFAEQKKESVLASVQTVRPEELKVPSSNLSTAIAGRISGVISYQRSGEPGQDNAEFFIRGVTSFGSGKKDPLILIDGVELTTEDFARLQPDDIASFSIMKDAAATALYGARGANGVVLVTTKEGKEGQTNVSVRFENSLSMPTQEVDLADPLTYMKLHTEAVKTRDPLGATLYSRRRIIETEKGINPLVNPTNDWHEMMFKDYTVNQRLNVNVRGGGKKAQYYFSGAFNQDNGILKVDDKNDFNSNIDLKRFLLRSNINVNLTKTTKAKIRFNGTFDDYGGPLEGGTGMYNMAMRANPALFPAFFPADEKNQHKDYILFGNYGTGADHVNPYAEMLKGYKDYSRTSMLAQFELHQDLSFVTPGLKFNILGNTVRYSFFDVKRQYQPYFFGVGFYDHRSGEFDLENLNEGDGDVTLDYREGKKEVKSTFYLQSVTQYNKDITDKHAIGAMVALNMREALTGNASDLQSSLASRNLGVSGRLTYAYDNRYFTEFNFGYNGSERFAANERFGFFPSAGLGWYVSNEPFWEPFEKAVTKLKFTATYGLVGNDQIGRSEDRFFYLSNVNLNNGNKGARFGKNFDDFIPGVSISRYENDQITWETSRKLNLGVQLGLFDVLDIQADYFTDHRENILMSRASIPTTMGLQATTSANVGEASSRGVDISVDYQHSFGPDFFITARGNFTYATSEFEVYEEPDYGLAGVPWLSKVGHSLSQQWGLVAERLFVDDYEVENSPRQTFGEYGAGDIKYKDINNDGEITDLDRVPIGYPTQPEIVYGFGVSIHYKNFDLSCFFQGLGRESFWIDPLKTAPFIHYNDDNQGWDNDMITSNALLQEYADSHWSEANRDIYATWPRLSTTRISNNEQRSTWFMRNGAFLRLKNAEIGYSLPKEFLKRFRLKQLRLYVSGTNLLTWSKFDLWDPEMGANGLGYPVQKVLNTGLQVSF